MRRINVAVALVVFLGPPPVLPTPPRTPRTEKILSSSSNVDPEYCCDANDDKDEDDAGDFSESITNPDILDPDLLFESIKTPLLESADLGIPVKSVLEAAPEVSRSAASWRLRVCFKPTRAPTLIGAFINVKLLNIGIAQTVIRVFPGPAWVRQVRTWY